MTDPEPRPSTQASAEQLTSPAVADLCAAVGEAFVILDHQPRREAETATFATDASLRAIVRPADRGEVQAVVRIANRYGLRLYPISRGKNWGLGSRVPTCDGALLLDLGRMERILDYDPEMAHVTVEPGVTFGALTGLLRREGGRHFLSMTGSTAGSSVVGNTLERGDGVGPLGDRAAHVCALEVVLPSGEVIETGFAGIPGARTARLYRWGVGPSLDGLFTQSNLGIVTRMTVWLTPAPAVMLAFRFGVADVERLGSTVDALRQLRLEGTLRSLVALWNDYRVLSARTRYPWDRTGGETPLDRPTLRSIVGEDSPEWYGIGSVYAPSEAFAAAARARIHELLGPRVDSLLFEERRSGCDAVERTCVQGDGDKLSVFGTAEQAFSVFCGEPQSASLETAYFRKRDPRPEGPPDLDRDRCGVLWSCPVLPLRAADVAIAVGLCEGMMLERGFEPLLALLAQHDRSAYLVPIIVYDRDVEGEDDRARACHDDLLAALIEAGYPPYRLGVQSMRAMPTGDGAEPSLLERIKRTLDPEDILAPGRYDLRHAWGSR